MDINNIFKNIAQYKMMEEEAARLRKEYEEMAKAYMTENDLETLVGDEHKAIYKEIVSNRLDTTRLKKEMPEIAEQYMKESKSMRFTFA